MTTITPYRAMLKLAISCGTAIFLDVAEDRYFALPAAVNAILLRVLAGGPVTDADRSVLEEPLGEETVAMLCAGAIRPVSATRPTSDLSKRPHVRIGRLAVASATLHVLRERAALWCLGLEAALSPIRYGTPYRIKELSPTALLTVAAHRRAHRWTSAHHNCLARSIALARSLLKACVDAQLFIGVTVAPFRAHSWVQVGQLLVNDRLERVLPFEPIAIFP